MLYEVITTIEIGINFSLQSVNTPFQSLGKTVDGGEGIIDFMSHTGGQGTDRGHFLRLVELGLKLFFQGNVTFKQQDLAFPGGAGLQGRGYDLIMFVIVIDLINTESYNFV